MTTDQSAMPELPEIETICRGLAPRIQQQRIIQVIVRERRFRWPVAPDLEQTLANQIIHQVTRRAKYLLFSIANGTLIVHLGMSGRLQVLTFPRPVQKHDHVDMNLANGLLIRLTDPRRFGALLWTHDPPDTHPLLQRLGLEPFSNLLTADYLQHHALHRRIPIKSLLMDNHVLVGIGNIYANEALFRAGIHPYRAASQLHKARLERLIDAVREVLAEAIQRGGTTLRDFVSSSGEIGYFQQELRVYGRCHLPCVQCGHAIRCERLGQRATYFCARCQR